MRVRQLKVNPKTSQDTLSKMRAIHNESVQLFEERRDIGGFLNQVKQKLKEKNSTIYKLQGELNLNKKNYISMVRQIKTTISGITKTCMRALGYSLLHTRTYTK